MAEITRPDYPGERLIACYNPFLAADRARTRGELLDATEAELTSGTRSQATSDHHAFPQAAAPRSARSGGLRAREPLGVLQHADHAP
jgi:hypothetical protein